MKLLVLQGPNLNLLGQRQPEVYGAKTLADVQSEMDQLASQIGVTLEHYQSNLEGDLIQRVQDAAKAGMVGAIVNAGGFTHTSVALRDTFLSTNLPFVEIHISCILARESFRHTSLLSDLASGVVMGFGTHGYLVALRAFVETLRRPV